MAFRTKTFSLEVIMTYLEFLTSNKVSVHMVANNISALKGKFHYVWSGPQNFEHPRKSYFIKSINRPLTIPTGNIMSVAGLKASVSLCDDIPFGQIFKESFLLLFSFFRISNIAPHNFSLRPYVSPYS